MRVKTIHNDLMLLANKEIAEHSHKDSSKPEKESMAKAIYF